MPEDMSRFTRAELQEIVDVGAQLQAMMGAKLNG
jgi:hypothetical protein